MGDDPVVIRRVVPNTTTRFSALFTPARYVREVAAMKFIGAKHSFEGTKLLPAFQDRIDEGPINRGAATPAKARACDAVDTVLRRKQHKANPGSPLMRRGDERC